MDISFLLKTIGVGVIVAVSGYMLQKSGRDEQALLVTAVGAVAVLLMLVSQMDSLLDEIRKVFGL